MFNCLFPNTEFICIQFLLASLRVPVHVYSIPLSRIALRMKKRRSDLCTRQMLTIFTIIILTSLVIVHFYQMAFHGILESLLLCQSVCTEQNLVFLRYIGALQVSITDHEANILGGLKSGIVLLKLFHHRCEKFI